MSNFVMPEELQKVAGTIFETKIKEAMAKASWLPAFNEYTKILTIFAENAIGVRKEVLELLQGEDPDKLIQYLKNLTELSTIIHNSIFDLLNAIAMDTKGRTQ